MNNTQQIPKITQIFIFLIYIVGTIFGLISIFLPFVRFLGPHLDYVPELGYQYQITTIFIVISSLLIIYSQIQLFKAKNWKEIKFLKIISLIGFIISFLGFSFFLIDYGISRMLIEDQFGGDANNYALVSIGFLTLFLSVSILSIAVFFMIAFLRPGREYNYYRPPRKYTRNQPESLEIRTRKINTTLLQYCPGCGKKRYHNEKVCSNCGTNYR